MPVGMMSFLRILLVIAAIYLCGSSGPLDANENSPSNYNTAYIFGGAALAGSSLFFLDEPLREFAQDNRSNGLDIFFEIPNQLGESYTYLLLSGGLYLGGLAGGNVALEKTGLYVAEAGAMSAGVTYLIKSILGRSRPCNNEGNWCFRFFEFEDKYLSMPSGHSAMSFSIATVLAHRIDEPYAYVTFYTLSTLTAFSRIYFDKHWISDTFFGSLIGIASGLLVLEWNDGFADKTKEPAPMNRPVNIISFSFSF